VIALCFSPLTPSEAMTAGELPISSDLLPHHDILAGGFLRRRTLVFKLKASISRAAEHRRHAVASGANLTLGSRA